MKLIINGLIIKQTILRCLNLQPFKSGYKSLAEYYLDIVNSTNNHYYAGFPEFQTVKLSSGNSKTSELQIDDILEDQQIVEGIVIHQNMTEPCYQIIL